MAAERMRSLCARHGSEFLRAVACDGQQDLRLPAGGVPSGSIPGMWQSPGKIAS
jgi:hypothetical protein